MGEAFDKLRLSPAWASVILVLLLALASGAWRYETRVADLSSTSAVRDEQYKTICETQIRLENKIDRLLDTMNVWAPRLTRVETELNTLKDQVRELRQ